LLLEQQLSPFQLLARNCGIAARNRSSTQVARSHHQEIAGAIRDSLGRKLTPKATAVQAGRITRRPLSVVGVFLIGVKRFNGDLELMKKRVRDCFEL
jgi:hypothetical protein